ncbi:unnamed protein product [Sphenostylis stenocarpa]|uniref:DUF4057 domain-containing protein n=1 Tax=Sphenostylis stenocarpa TaxID=92480 RepID=A0AA86S7N5_9FABA|nr:unnamed protein product [Sphenostylis stenocarpa]
MQRTKLLRNPHTSTSDLLTWSEQPPPQSASGHRSRQPSDKIGEVLRGSQLTEEEAQSLARRKPCSGYKMQEMTGSGIFSGNAEDTTTSETKFANSKHRTSIRVYQQAMNRISHISFSPEGNVSPKIPTSLPEIAKQRELSGTYQSESDTKIKKNVSSAKTKELSGSDIFAPPEIVPRSSGAERTLESKESKDTREPVPRKVRASALVSNAGGGQRDLLFREEPVKKTLRKIHEQKFADLTGKNIFKRDVPAGSQGKPSSRAKLREMAGNDIFADGKAENRDHIRGARRPPGGGSSLALV